MDPYLRLMAFGFLMTITVETAVLFLGLAPVHARGRRLFAGVWLTACTYPIVWLVIPAVFDPFDDRALYLWVAETFAPAAECLLFWLAFDLGQPRQVILRDMVAITLANLASFGLGELLLYLELWPGVARQAGLNGPL